MSHLPFLSRSLSVFKGFADHEILCLFLKLIALFFSDLSVLDIENLVKVFSVSYCFVLFH